MELRPARAAVAAVAQRARRHRAVALPAGHRAADGVCDRMRRIVKEKNRGSDLRESGLRYRRMEGGCSSRSLTDDGGEHGGERGEDVGGGDGAEGQHRHHDRGGAGNPSSASSRREHLGVGVGVGSAACGRLCSLVVAFPCVGGRLRFKWEGGKAGARAVGRRRHAGRGSFYASRLPCPGLTGPPRLHDAAAAAAASRSRNGEVKASTQVAVALPEA